MSAGGFGGDDGSRDAEEAEKMRNSARAAAVVIAVVTWGLYLRAAITADDDFGWTNAWMGPAIGSITLVVVAFVLTAERSGVPGTPISNLRSALAHVKIDDPVEGSAQVISASSPPRSGQNAGRAMCTMNLVVTVPGRPSVAVEGAQLVQLSRWPTPGMQLPIVAERTDPTRYRILWDHVPTGWSMGNAAAHQLADWLNATPGSGVGDRPGSMSPPGGRVVHSRVIINGREATAEDLATYERLTGLDLNGDGVVAGSGVPSPPGATGTNSTHGAAGAGGAGGVVSTGGAGGSDRDAVSQLERLAALRDSGAITESEFQIAKRQVLGGA